MAREIEAILLKRMRNHISAADQIIIAALSGTICCLAINLPLVLVYGWKPAVLSVIWPIFFFYQHKLLAKGDEPRRRSIIDIVYYLVFDGSLSNSDVQSINPSPIESWREDIRTEYQSLEAKEDELLDINLSLALRSGDEISQIIYKHMLSKGLNRINIEATRKMVIREVVGGRKEDFQIDARGYVNIVVSIIEKQESPILTISEDGLHIERLVLPEVY